MKIFNFKTLLLAIGLVVASVQPMWASVTYSSEYEIFFNVQDNNNFKWTDDNARLWLDKGSGNWIALTQVHGTWYSAKLPAGTYTTVKFKRQDPNSEKIWNEISKDLVSNKNCWWANGSEWGYMIPIHGGTFYFDDSKTQMGTVALLVGRSDYTSVYPMKNISNTQLYYYDMNVWAYATYITFVQCTNWDDGKWGSDNRKNCGKYTNTYNGHYDFNSSNWYLFTTSSGANNTDISPAWKGQLSDFNKAQSVEIWVSTDGGSTYSQKTTSLSTYGDVKATYYYMSSYNGTTRNSDQDIVANSHNAVITSTMSLNATAATGYTLKGYSTSSSSVPTTTDVSKPYTYTISDETTTRVYFALQSHNITYAENSDIASYTAQPTTGYYGSTITITATATANHVITGASTNVDGVTPTFTSGQNTQTATVKFTMPASDIELTLVTALGKVNLNFGAGANGSLIAKIGKDTQTTGSQINGGSVVDFTATPNPGYQVEGWYSDSGFDTKIDESKETTRQITANADVNVYVKFAPITYNITYNETHSVTHSNPDIYTIETETITFTTPTTDRTGYDFAGWSPATIDKGSYGNKTITATWTAHTYSVHFDANSTEGIAGSMEDQTGFTYDVNKTLTACNFTKQGYTFAGWNTKADGTGTNYNNSASVMNLTAEDNATVTLYAKWTPVNFTLSLTSNQKDSHNIHQIQQGSSTPITLTTTVTLGGNPYTLDLSHFDYTYKLVGSDGEPTPISTQTTNSTTWSAPTKVGHYTLTVSYNDGTITNKSASIDFVVWDEYTFYIWETGQDLNTADQNANKVHVYHKTNTSDADADYSETTWGDSPEGLRDITDLAAQWGGGWHGFTIKYPLYNYFIVGYNAYKADKYQSNAYYLSKEPSAKDTYLRCNYHNDGKWTWGDHSISEPTKPQIEITAVNVYATKIVAKINVKPSNSIVTAHSFTVNGETKELSNFSTTDEDNYNITLTNLTESTDYTFAVSATNALGTTEETQTITTLAKAPITFMIKVSSNLMANTDNMWGWNNTTSVNLHYWNDASGLNGDVELKEHVDGNGYWAYTYTIEDSPCSFFVYNHNCLTHDQATGNNRSANWNDANADGCALVQDAIGEYSNHVLTTQQYCTTRYQLVYTNTSNYKTYSNIIEDKDETLSLFVALDGTLEMKKYDPATAKWIETPVFTTSKRPTTAGVYNLNLVNVTNFENITEANLSDFTAYKGKYYIRTDAATGGWQEYLFADKDNAMTQFTPRTDKGENYSYYWVKNVAKNGTVRVSACVGNEFNPDLANMLKADEFVRTGEDGHGYIDKLDGVGANVRFSYEPTTNEFKRAVIGGSSANNFLNVYSNDENLYATKNGEELSNLLDGLQKEAAISRFNDVSDWVYEKVVYVKVVDEQSAANVILQSVFNNKTNHLLGYKTDGTTPKPLEVLGKGTNPDTYTIRITYDYKKNRLMASWEPGTMQISTTQSINTDILFIQREHKGDENDNANGTIDNVDVAQITYTQDGIEADAELTSLKNIMYVLEVTPQVIKGTAADNQEYWITLPFDCRVSDVFGVEDYVKLDANGNAVSGTWGIMRYDGATRASHGWFLDDYSTFWRWMTRDETMHAGEGYVVIFDKTNASSWPSINVDGENKQVKRLYFPSMTTGFTISYSKDNSSVEYSNNPCMVEKRGNQDANWKVLGPKSYNNIEVDDNTVGNNLTYYYTYDQARESGQRYVEHTVATEPKLKAFHSYMSQFGGTLTWKPFTKSDPASSPLYAVAESEFKGGMLTVELNNAQGTQLDRTFVNLHKNGTLGFDQNMELTKITENCAQIASISEDVLYAGSTLPLDIEMVPLNVKVVANGTYDIALEQSLEGLEVRLLDAFEQTTTVLDMMPATVTLDKGEYKDRFFLQFVQKSPLTPTNFNGTIEQFNLPTDKTQKLLINDNIYLINGGRIYNASGSQVK